MSICCLSVSLLPPPLWLSLSLLIHHLCFPYIIFILCPAFSFWEERLPLNQPIFHAIIWHWWDSVAGYRVHPLLAPGQWTVVLTFCPYWSHLHPENDSSHYLMSSFQVRSGLFYLRCLRQVPARSEARLLFQLELSGWVHGALDSGTLRERQLGFNDLKCSPTEVAVFLHTVK